MTEPREPGFYWVRTNGDDGAHLLDGEPEVAKWDGRAWWAMDIGKPLGDDFFAVLSGRLTPPQLGVVEPDETVIQPMMQTLRETVIVKKPDAEMAPPQIGRYGGLSLGAHHIKGPGAVMSIALHHPDGTTLLGSIGHAGYCELAHAFNAWGARIQAGEFDQPETAQ